MPLMLIVQLNETESFQLWVNPNPQSDTFCRPKSMSWVKEKDHITKEAFESFFSEAAAINQDPVVIPICGSELCIKVSAIFAMVDGKAANAIVNNRDTHACPICIGSDPRVGPAYFHSRLNTVEWLIRVSAQKHTDGHPAQANPAVKAKAREIADRLEDAFKINVNRPKIGGSGTSNNGNMARRLLEDTECFANILGISDNLIKSVRLISCLALSSRKLDAEKVRDLYVTLEKLVKEEFPFLRRLPPCVHKYYHLPEYIDSLPYPLNFIDEQSGERSHKRYKFSRPHLARKTSPEDNLTDMMRTSLAWSDPKMSDLEYKLTRHKDHKSGQDFAKEIARFYADHDIVGAHPDSSDEDPGSDNCDSDSIGDSE